jgi:riboflavin-specific deaminase-like protein
MSERPANPIDRPYTLLSCAVSVDGYLDDTGPERLLLSNDADFDRVDEVRAGVDAILVGAGTIRADDPRLLIRDPTRRAARLARDEPPDPVKVTLTASGDLDPSARFFRLGDGLKLVYTPVPQKARQRLGDAATIVAADTLTAVLGDLAARGVRRLMVEGGARVLHQFLDGDLADELHLAVAPISVGDPAAPRFTAPARAFRLAEVRAIGDVALLRYLLTPAAVDRHWLRIAIGEAGRCPRSAGAFAVGAVIVERDGHEIARGFSREGGDPYGHAEEAALAKAAGDPRLRTATLYSSLEPCGERKSRARPCAELIRAAGVPRVVYAWREPPLFVEGHGADVLQAGGIEVVQIAELAGEARAVNAHLFPV